jgi:UDP-N-acetylmuramate dehydrogenase
MQIQQGSFSKLTSLRVGGECNIWTPNSVNELQNFLKNNSKNVLFLGLGSNILASDKSFDGVVIRTKNLNEISIKNNQITAFCGVTLAKFARFCTQNNQASANFLSSIPGGVGGSLFMNAGCFGKEIWHSVKSVQTIDKFGNIFNRTLDDFEISYRKTINKYKNEYFLSANFEFDNNPISEKILKNRYESQPIGTANCGSVFKNPDGDFAARLIEKSGLKGFKIGGAEVSKKHANFIINFDNASSDDIKNIIKHIQKTIKSKFNITLETEVQMI